MRLHRRKWQYIIPIALLAFALRVWGLADHSIWWDEGIGVWLSRMPILESTRWTAGDVHPPLYYVALRGWRQVAGEGEYVLRFPSALFSFLTIPLIYRLGKQIGGERTGWLAALFLTLSRFSISWAQQIRMYALAAMLTTGTLWSAAWLWRRAQRRWIGPAWWLYVATTLGSFYTLYLTVTVAAVTNLGFLVAWWARRRREPNREHRRRLWAWIGAQGAVAALYLPWLLYALPRMHAWSSDAAFAPGFFVQLYTTMLAVGSPLDLDAYRPLILGLFIALALGVALTWRRRRAPVQVGGRTMLLAGLLLPPAVVALVSLPALRFYFSRPLVPRYLLPLSSCYYTLVAWTISELMAHAAPHPGVRRGLAGALAALSLVTAIVGLRAFYPGRARTDDFVTIAAVLEAHRRPADAVVLYVDRDWPIFTAHYGGDRRDIPYGADLDFPGAAESYLGTLWSASDALWLVTTPEALQTDPQQALVSWLEAHAVAVDHVVDGANTLTFYARAPERAESYTTPAPSANLVSAATHLDTPFGLRAAQVPLTRYRTGDTLHLGLYWAAKPPEGTQILLEGPSLQSLPVPSVAVPGSLTRIQVDLALTPELAGGPYKLYVAAPGFAPVHIGDFRLLSRAVGSDVLPSDIPYPVEYRLGDAIELIGYALPERDIPAGDSVPLTLYWRAGGPIAQRYKVFTHILGDTFNPDTGNFLWGQQDNEPVSGQAQTTLWAPGTVIADHYRIAIDPDAPPGTYVLEVGMYGLVDGTRLAVRGPEGAVPDNAIILTTVEVQ